MQKNFKGVCSLLLLVFSLYGKAQKKIIDSFVIANWPDITNKLLSNDGNYLMYSVSEGSYLNTSWFLTSTDGKWQMTFKGLSEAEFSSDSRFVQLRYNSDTIKTIDLHLRRVIKTDPVHIRVQVNNNKELLDSIAASKIGTDFIISTGLSFFSQDSLRFFFYATRKISRVSLGQTATAALKLSGTLSRKNLAPTSYLHCMNLNSGRYEIQKIQDDNDEIAIVDPYHQEFVCFYSKFPDGKFQDDNLFDAYERTKRTVSVFSLINNSKIVIGNNIRYVYFSPDAKYLIWYNLNQRSWISYDLQSGNQFYISKSIPVNLDYENSVFVQTEFGIMGWDTSHQKVYLYDEFDIWSVDLNANKKPINVTNGWGRNNAMQLRLVNTGGFPNAKLPTSDDQYIIRDNFLVSGFNNQSKENVMLQIAVDHSNHTKLTQLSKIDHKYWYSTVNTNILGQSGLDTRVIKARDANKYIVTRMSANEYPNIYFTNDFKKFIPLTHLAPEKKMNWLTSQLMKFKVGETSVNGILYKPENFDSTKKYPVIFYYYEINSDGANYFIMPRFCNGQLSIPWFVSRNYLVFVPDINTGLRPAKTGENAFLIVNAAANMLSKFSWVDSVHMGIQGHSFGGYITNSIVVRTSRFAAAASSNGISDLVSHYLAGVGQFGLYEKGQSRMVKPLWENVEAYLKESPILKADNIKTPLLILHNEGDKVVPFEQGNELYQALKRLQKPAWLLNYVNENHAIWDHSENQYDYTIKLTEFFDHYLKETPLPEWMK
jgi:dipeptidyl aminopeptidase/acylaminoacyl peptidase